MPVRVKTFWSEIADFEGAGDMIDEWIREESEKPGFDLVDLRMQHNEERVLVLVVYRLGGESEAKTCPQCGNQLVPRVRRADGQKFWGCSSFPDCRYVLNMDGTEGNRVSAGNGPIFVRGYVTEKPKQPKLDPPGSGESDDDDHLPF